MRMNRSAVLAAAIGATLAARSVPTAASTITFLGGDGVLSTTANWSGVPVNPPNNKPIGTTNGTQHDLVFDDNSTLATSTWGATATSYYVNTVIFSRTGGFAMASHPSGTIFLMQGNNAVPSVTTTAAEVYGMPGHSPVSTGALYSLAAGSTLNVNTAMAAGADMRVVKTGAGTAPTLNLFYGTAARDLKLTAGAGVLVNNNGPAGNGTTITSLSGDGTLDNVAGRMRLKVQDFAANGFTGTIRSNVASNSSHVIFEDVNPGANTYTFTGGRFLADVGAFKGVNNITLQGSEMANTGAGTRSRFSFADNINQNDGSGNAKLLTAAGVSFKPGQDGVAKIMQVFGDVKFQEYNSADSKLFIDITGAGNTAGADYDQLFIAKASLSGGGDVASASDAVNRLADLDLFVDVSNLLTDPDVAGDTFTILRTDKTGFSFVGSAFADVTFSPGWDGDVNYNNNGTVTISNLAQVPEPTTIGVIVLAGLALARRRRRHA